MNTVPDSANTPCQVRWKELVDSGNIDERVSAVTVLFGSVIGVDDGYVSWCPDDIPPSEQERLAWIWLCNPSLSTQIEPMVKGLFRDLMIAYREGEMSRWWQQVLSQHDR